MREKIISDITLADARTWGSTTVMGDDLVLSDTLAGGEDYDEPHRINFIVMALCQKGEAHYAIDTREHHVRQGDLLFISENHIMDFFHASSDFESMSIMVSTEFYHSFLLNVKNISSLLLFSTNHPVVTLTADEINTYESFFQNIRLKISNVDHPFRIELVKTLLLAMFYDMSGVIWRIEQLDAKDYSRANALFSQFIRLLESEFKRERRVHWYARQMSITPKYLSEVVRQVSKRTPNYWIDHYVVLELRVLLKNSTKSIKEITKQMNFPNQSFLGKYFKSHVGMSPLDFRRS